MPGSRLDEDSTTLLGDNLQLVPEAFNSFDDDLTSIGFLVLNVVIRGCDQHRHDCQRRSREASVQARMIIWSILRAKRDRANDATNTASGHKRCVAESTAPLSNDVDALICSTRRDIGATSTDDKVSKHAVSGVIQELGGLSLALRNSEPKGY